MVKKCLSRMSGKLSRTVLRRGKGSNPFSLVDYCSVAYIEELEKNGFIRSMSRKGNPFDNACAESFFSTIKSERLHHRTYNDIEEARRDIFWYIECFYNRQRRHQALGNLTPVAFLKKYYEAQTAA